MIKVKAVAKKNPQTKEVKYYAQMGKIRAINREEFIKRLEKSTTATSADVKAVLDQLEYELFQALSDGYSVRLGNVGSFRAGLTSEASETLEAVTAKNVKRVRVRFTPSSMLQREMQPAPKGRVSISLVKE